MVEYDLVVLEDESRPLELIMHSRMINDHFINAYESGLLSAMERME